MNSIGQLAGLYNLSPATMAGLANVSGAKPQPDAVASFLAGTAPPPPATTDTAPMPIQDPAQLQALAGSMQQQEQAVRADEQSAAVNSHAAPMQRPTADKSADSFHELANVDFKKLQADNAAKEAAANGVSAQPQMQQGPPSFAPVQTIPAHWQPGTHEVEVKRGIAPEVLEPGMIAKGESFRAGDQAAAQRYAASQLNQAADVDAGRSAAIQLAAAQNQIRALDAHRKAYIADEHAKLEALNAQANAKVDTSEAFVGGDIGRILAAVAMGLGQFAATWKGGTNGAMQIVNDAVNSTIKRQEANAAIARGAYGDRMNLYRENLSTFGEDRAGLATKIQLLDKVAQLADKRRAEAGALGNDAAYNDMRGKIAAERGAALDGFAEKTADHYGEKMNESFKPAAMFGGASSTKREGNLVTLSDGTTFVMPSEKVAQESISKIQTLDQLQRFNNEIIALRQKAYGLTPGTEEYKNVYARLEDIGEQKASMVSKSLDQGVLKDSEYERAMAKNVGTTNGLGLLSSINPLNDSNRSANDAMLRAQTKRWSDDQRSHVTSAGGAVYQRGYAVDANGQLKPVGQFTGQDATPTEHLAPNGSKPIDNRVQLPTPGPKTSSLIPQAPRMGTIPARPATPATTKKRH